MKEYKPMLITAAIVLAMLAVWDLFLRQPAAKLLTKGDDAPVE